MKNYSEQDIVYAFSRNDHEDDKPDEVHNDIIGLSSINLPHQGKVIRKEFQNFYNCVYSHQVSYFNKNKNLITHPGEISFFEVNVQNEENSFLATSNGDLENIFIWNLNKKREIKNLLKKEEDVPDYFLNGYKGFEFENIRWSRNNFTISSTLYDQKKNKSLFCKYDLNFILNQENLQDGEKNNDIYPNEKIEMPFNINYFVINDLDENQVIGTSQNKKFLMDLRQPKQIKYFENNSNLNQKSEIIVEYNQENSVIFVNRFENNIEIYDVRKENEKLLKVEFECPVRKIEFDPFNKKEFIILFKNYFVLINFANVKYNTFWFGEKKLNDFSFNHYQKEEFLICGDTNNPENHIYPGFLSVNKFPDA